MLPTSLVLLGVLSHIVYKQISLLFLFLTLSLIITIALSLIERKEKRESPVQDTDEKRDEKWW